MIPYTHLHAMIVHFPIALLLAGFLSELIGLLSRRPFFRQAGFYLLLLGAAGSAAAYFSGEGAGAGMEDGSLGRAVEVHEQSALITVWLTAIAAGFRLMVEVLKRNRGWMRGIGVLLFALTIASIVRTGYLGGQLVYKHAAGVELALPGFQEETPENP